MMFRFLRTSVLIISIVGGLGLVSVLATPPAPVAAVDIFKHCTSTATPGVINKASCADCASDIGKTTDYCKEVAAQTGSNPAVHAIKLIINVVSFIAGAAAIISLVVSGLKMILANGDANAVTSARNGILYSLIGIGVIVLAQAIVVFILDKVK